MRTAGDKSRKTPVEPALMRGLATAGDCPDDADHLAGDRSGDCDLRLADRGQAPISRAQPDLRFPRCSGDRGSNTPTCRTYLCVRSRPVPYRPSPCAHPFRYIEHSAPPPCMRLVPASGTTLDTCVPRDGPPITQRALGLDHRCGSAECDDSGVA